MTIYNDLLTTTDADRVEEIVEHDLLPAVLEDQSVDDHAVDLSVYGSGDIDVDPDQHFDARGFDLERVELTEHSEGTLAVIARASSVGLFRWTGPEEYAAIHGILRLSLTLSESDVGGDAKLVLAPL